MSPSPTSRTSTVPRRARPRQITECYGMLRGPRPASVAGREHGSRARQPRAVGVPVAESVAHGAVLVRRLLQLRRLVLALCALIALLVLLARAHLRLGLRRLCTHLQSHTMRYVYVGPPHPSVIPFDVFRARGPLLIMIEVHVAVYITLFIGGH